MERNLSPDEVKAQIAKLEEEVRRLQKALVSLRSRQLVDALMAQDGPLPRENKTVIRTTRGLTVKGTRLTLYSIMDGIKEDNSLKNVRDIYELTDEEMLDVLDYIHLHRKEVETEYQEVVRRAEESKRYWEERNRDRFSKLSSRQETVRVKLREWRAQYHAGPKT
jgi:uncharacterized protein (DUF433 family)